jgi:hypothetical protein
VVEIDAKGWRILSQPPPEIKFFRPTDGFGEMPRPVKGGNIDKFKPYLNLSLKHADRAFILFVGFILSCYRQVGEMLSALLLGPHGSAKTTAARRLAALVDPLVDEPGGPPRIDRDIMVTALVKYLQLYDNVKAIGPEREAQYCRLLSGSRQSGRALFTDKSSFSMSAKRPILQTSTALVIQQTDLNDRSMVIHMGPSFGSDEAGAGERRTMNELNAEFVKAWPELLGAILTAVSTGLKRKNYRPSGPLPRMADATTWISRCEAGLGWKKDTFIDAYRAAIKDSARDLAEADPVSAAVLSIMHELKAKRPQDSSVTRDRSTMAALYAEMKEPRHTPQREQQRREFPTSTAALGHRLSELEQTLRDNGVVMQRKRTDAARFITLTFTPPVETDDEVSG